MGGRRERRERRDCVVGRGDTMNGQHQEEEMADMLEPNEKTYCATIYCLHSATAPTMAPHLTVSRPSCITPSMTTPAETMLMVTTMMCPSCLFAAVVAAAWLVRPSVVFYTPP